MGCNGWNAAFGMSDQEMSFRIPTRVKDAHSTQNNNTVY